MRVIKERFSPIPDGGGFIGEVDVNPTRPIPCIAGTESIRAHPRESEVPGIFPLGWFKCDT